MQTIGLIGGLSWESSAVYYKILNQQMQARLGGIHSCKCLMYSVDLGEIVPLQHSEDWAALTATMVDAAQRLERGGADFILLCTNTMHKVADEMQASVGIPLLHIADATAEAIHAKQMKKVALLGTKFTMDNDFYKERLSRYGIETIIPNEKERDFIHSSIFEELGKNIFTGETKQKYLEIIENMSEQGAEGVIFGCTEIPMLLKPVDCPIPSFDTTLIHARAAVDFALAD